MRQIDLFENYYFFRSENEKTYDYAQIIGFNKQGIKNKITSGHGGALGITVIIIGDEIDDPSSNL